VVEVDARHLGGRPGRSATRGVVVERGLHAPVREPVGEEPPDQLRAVDPLGARHVVDAIEEAGVEAQRHLGSG
jgi:hypothetical protein